jgi:hypothetical protein
VVLLLSDREVPDDFGQLIDVARLELFDVALVTARPVSRHVRLLLAKAGEHFLDLLVVDHVANAYLVGAVGRDHQYEGIAIRQAQDGYSRISPKTSFFSRRSTTAAPW